MQYTSYFKHPTKGILQYPMSGRTLAEETTAAKAFDGNIEFGQYRYSRPVEQVPLKTDQLYQLSVRQNELHYRNIEEELFAQFDYFRFQGPHRDKVVLQIEHNVYVEAFNETLPVRVFAEIEGAQTAKFKDFCKEYVFGIISTPQGPRLAGFSKTTKKEIKVLIALKVLLRED